MHTCISHVLFVANSHQQHEYDECDEHDDDENYYDTVRIKNNVSGEAP